MDDRKTTARREYHDKERDTRRTAALHAQRAFAPSLNAVTWALLQKPERSPQEDEKMLYAAFASAFHYLEVGDPSHHQRATWLISRVYNVLGNGVESLRHARRCMELTQAHADSIADYDRAFALEALARAHALLGNRDDAAGFHQRAQEAGHAIKVEENRRIFLEEFQGGNWHGIG